MEDVFACWALQTKRPQPEERPTEASFQVEKEDHG
jgi:hypothetical protein